MAPLTTRTRRAGRAVTVAASRRATAVPIRLSAIVRMVDAPSRSRASKNLSCGQFTGQLPAFSSPVVVVGMYGLCKKMACIAYSYFDSFLDFERKPATYPLKSLISA